MAIEPDTDAGAERLRIVGIMGSGRSGSTLLEYLLAGYICDSHALGELEGLLERAVADNELCSCGEPAQDCARWQKLLASLESTSWWRTLDAWRTDRRRRIPWGAALVGAAAVRRLLGIERIPIPGSGRRPVAHYTELLTALGHERFHTDVLIDNSKTPLHFFTLAATGRVDLAVVQVVRKPQALIWSWRRATYLPEARDKDWTFEPRPATRVARAWLFDLAMSAAFRITHKNVPFVRISYEELCADPSATLRRCTRALGLPTGDEPARPADYHVVGGNPARFGRFTEIRIDDEWESGMSRELKAVLGITLGPVYRWVSRRSSGNTV